MHISILQCKTDQGVAYMETTTHPFFCLVVLYVFFFCLCMRICHLGSPSEQMAYGCCKAICPKTFQLTNQITPNLPRLTYTHPLSLSLCCKREPRRNMRMMGSECPDRHQCPEKQMSRDGCLENVALARFFLVVLALHPKMENR